MYGVLGYLLCVFSVLSFSTVRKQCPCAHTTRARPLTDPRARSAIRWRPYPCGFLATVGGPTSPDPRAVIDPRQRPRVASRPVSTPNTPETPLASTTRSCGTPAAAHAPRTRGLPRPRPQPNPNPDPNPNPNPAQDKMHEHVPTAEMQARVISPLYLPISPYISLQHGHTAEMQARVRARVRVRG